MRLDRARGDDSPWTRARDARDDDDDDDDDGDDDDDDGTTARGARRRGRRARARESDAGKRWRDAGARRGRGAR